MVSQNLWNVSKFLSETQFNNTVSKMYCNISKTVLAETQILLLAKQPKPFPKQVVQQKCFETNV